MSKTLRSRRPFGDLFRRLQANPVDRLAFEPPARGGRQRVDIDIGKFGGKVLPITDKPSAQFAIFTARDFRHAEGRMCRQAARFKICRDTSDGPVTAALTLNDGNALNLDTLTSKYLHLTDTQYFFLQQWAEGWFHDEAAAADLVLHGPLSQDFTPAHMQPGDVSRYMAVPWQADFNECASQPLDGRVLWWWPAQRPEFITFPDDVQRVQHWAGLGFVMKKFTPSVDGERDMAVARRLPRPFFPSVDEEGA